MKYCYEIKPRPVVLGGWRLRLIEDAQEAGRECFRWRRGHKTKEDILRAIFDGAEATAYSLLGSKERRGA